MRFIFHIYLLEILFVSKYANLLRLAETMKGGYE